MAKSKAELYEDLQPNHYYHLVRMTLEHVPHELTDHQGTVNVTLVLKKSMYDKQFLSVKTYGADDLKIERFGVNGCEGFGMLEITDMRDSQWQDLNYAVNAYDGNASLHFYCRDFDAEIRSE